MPGLSRGSEQTSGLLRLHGRPVHTVFDLLGHRENDMTFSLGWAIFQVPSLGAALLRQSFEGECGDLVVVRLQEFGEDRGFTDVELRTDREHLIIEAKRGWTLPTVGQLRRYSGRLEMERRALLVISECAPEYADHRLPKEVQGVPVLHRPWRSIMTLLQDLSHDGALAKRRLLRELERYLKGATTMQDLTSNSTYVVSVSNGCANGSSVTFKEFVVERGIYFHPYGVSGWPREAPNYIGFRWGGHVRRVHHVEGYAVFDDLHDGVPEIPSLEGRDPHAVYQLGPPIELVPPLPNGAPYRAARLRVPLDLLFTSPTLKDALAAGQGRREAAGA
jgi:hypothetical protein